MNHLFLVCITLSVAWLLSNFMFFFPTRTREMFRTHTICPFPRVPQPQMSVHDPFLLGNLYYVIYILASHLEFVFT